MNNPIDKQIIDEAAKSLHIRNLENATIREVVAIAGIIEQQTGLEFIRMEMGVPGLPASTIGVQAEIEALRKQRENEAQALRDKGIDPEKPFD